MYLLALFFIFILKKFSLSLLQNYKRGDKNHSSWESWFTFFTEDVKIFHLQDSLKKRKKTLHKFLSVCIYIAHHISAACEGGGGGSSRLHSTFHKEDLQVYIQYTLYSPTLREQVGGGGVFIQLFI